jgi:hypothetical protein
VCYGGDLCLLLSPDQTENADGSATLSWHTPGSVFAPYGSAALDAMAAAELDAIFEAIADDAARGARVRPAPAPAPRRSPLCGAAGCGSQPYCREPGSAPGCDRRRMRRQHESSTHRASLAIHSNIR